jgi:multiple sugar transport system permease protein
LIKVSDIKKEDLLTAILLLLPTFVLLILFVVYPLIKVIFNAFFIDIIYLNIRKWVFLNNFVDIFSDKTFWTCLYNSIRFATISVPFEIVLGFLIALFLYINDNKIVRFSVILPWALPTAIMALSWRFFLNEDYGIIPKFFAIFNFKDIYLSNNFFAFTWMILIDIWKTTPFIAILIYSALKGLNKEYLEAIDIEGGNWYHKIFWVIIPIIIPALTISIIFRYLYALAVFDLPLVLTGGGPSNSTKTLPMYIYENFFKFLDMGYASALTLFSTIVIFIIAYLLLIIFSKIFKRKI